MEEKTEDDDPKGSSNEKMGLDSIWLQYTEENEETYFRKYIEGFISSWNGLPNECQLSENWSKLVESCLQDVAHRCCGPSLSDLPDELLAALSKFLFVGKDQVESEGTVDIQSVIHMREITTCLTIIIFQNFENIPLVGSMAFVSQITQTCSLLLAHLLQMESSFFTSSSKTASERVPRRKKASDVKDSGPKKDSNPSLRSEIMSFIVSSCHFFEALYDPAFQWRAYISRSLNKSQHSSPEGVDCCPILLHQETIPFLYESFETALVDSFPDLAIEMLHVFGAVISGSLHNALRAISPATTKMILKTVRKDKKAAEGSKMNSNPSIIDQTEGDEEGWSTNIGKKSKKQNMKHKEEKKNTPPPLETRCDEKLYSIAIYCSAKSIQVLHETPIFERQLDITIVIEQYQEILTTLSEKDSIELPVIIEAVAVLSCMLETDTSNTLKKVLAKNDIISSLLQLVKESRVSYESKKMLLPVVVDTISLFLNGCPTAAEKMSQKKGYDNIFNTLNMIPNGPDSNILNSLLAMATHGTTSANCQKGIILSVEPILYLIRWIKETNYENITQQAWLIESLHELCCFNMQNKMLCCQSDVLVALTDVLKVSYKKLDPRCALQILKMIEALGQHSISPFELKQLIGLLQDKDFENQDSNDQLVGVKFPQKFPYKSHVIHVISSMARGSGFEVCRHYFDIPLGSNGLTVPNIRQWSSPINGFSFHCWFRLDHFSGVNSGTNDGSPTKELFRRQLYSFYTTSGNGFEAFITQKCILTIAVANKKEFLAVPLEDFPLLDEKWHSLQVIHSTAKRVFGTSHLQVWLDGTKRIECALKYVEKSEPFSYCQIGSPLCRGSIPALHDNLGNAGGTLGRKSSIKEGIKDAIKIGLPGVFYLPQTLTGKKEENDPHIRWTLIGLEDQLWGKAISLVGQIGMICCFKDALTATDTSMLHVLGPNRGLAFPQGEDHPDVIEFMNKIVFFYSASAIHSNSNVCPNLKTSVSGGNTYEAQVFTTHHSVQDVKDVINCIGGVQILFPLLEQAASVTTEESQDDTCVPNTAYLSLQSTQESIATEDGDSANDWEVLPSSSFADWKLEQNPISGFLTLVKNLVSHHTINTEQLMRGGGIPIIGVLLQKACANRIDVNVLMAAQLMVEMATSMNRDQRLLSQIYHSILFDFRIWSKSEFHVQIGHIQYLSTLIKEDRKYFRRRFGVQFFLDVIRQHYTSCSSLSEDDGKTIRMSLFGLIKFFMQKDITAKEVIPLNSFMLAIHDSTLLTEVIELVAHYLLSKTAKDQMFLVMHETRRADLLYCLLLDEALCQPKTKLVLPGDGVESSWPAYDARIHGETDLPQLIQVVDDENDANLRIHILHLISILLRTNKVSSRHKTRMNLQDSKGYLGLLHLRFKLLSSSEGGQPVSMEEVCALFDQMILFDDSTTYQGILGLLHHLQWSSLDIKLEIARKLMSFMFSKPEIPTHFAKQIGWQDCLARLLVKRMVKPELEQTIVSIDGDVMSFDENISFLDHEFSPTHLVEKAARSTGLSEETVEKMGDAATSATKVVNANKTWAKEKVTDTVLKTQGMVSHAQDKLFTNKIANKVYSSIDMVQSNMETIKKNTSDAGSGSHTPKSVNYDSVSMNSESQLVEIQQRAGRENTPRASTPNFMTDSSNLNRYEIFDVGGIDMDTDSFCFLQRSELKSTASGTSSEDVSVRGEAIESQKPRHGARLQSLSPSPSTTTMTSDTAQIIPDLEQLRFVDETDQTSKEKMTNTVNIHVQEEELCQLVLNILFTIMWRGKPGFPYEDVVKERGQVIACINMLGLNNELYTSHVDLKRRIVELCVQAVLADLRGNEHGVATNSASAEHVMQWAYDLIVLDTYGNFGKKVTESLLDGLLGMLECLMVFQEGGGGGGTVKSTDQQDVEWEAMGKMAFDILLKCAEHNSNEYELCAMATAKLHALVQTRSSSRAEENAYLIYRVSKIISESLNENAGASVKENNKEHFSFLAPIIKALLEKSKAQLNLTSELPSLNLHNQMSGPTFFEHFQKYQSEEEWNYFIEKKAKPLHDVYKQGLLTKLPHDMDVFWAECYETSKIASHKRSREVGESKLRFQSRYIEPYSAAMKAEHSRYNNVLSQQKSHLLFIQKRWAISKRLFFGPRGVWGIENLTSYNDPGPSFWKISSNENFLRMRMKLMPNMTFNPHLEASAQRDNNDPYSQGQPNTKESQKKRKTSVDNTNDEDRRQNVQKGNSVKDISKKLLQWQISKEVVQESEIEDSLTEEDMKSIAMEQMETLAEVGSDNKDLKSKSQERLILSVDCQLVTFMSVIKGKFELTTSYVYFFDTSPYNKGEDSSTWGDDGERKDFRWSLLQLREMHLRRFNLRRSGIEFFLLDQTNYFLNFPSNRKRNKVYSKIVSLKLPNMIYSSSRSPGDLLKSSGLTQKWVTRQITNFEYLMQLNTIAGRTFNDLSQYPVFPWILSDYSSHQLNLADPAIYRDLTKPMGIQNPKHVKEVKERYDNFEDPSGTVAKFHYGTHYSNSAMVLHYLVRVEPFASLHIELQSGRWDVADRQFHSISQSWKSLYENLNDVKELIPEFYYFPEFLLNLNNFDLGQLQGGKKRKVNNVELPRWAINAYDFIRKHREALESDFVSSQLHHWIDLIFGYKQKGEAANGALNVFYYCTYEGAVDLDAIKDESEREAVEGMINNFGQTPCQLLKDQHPARMSINDCLSQPHNKTKPNLLQLAPDWKPYLIDMGPSLSEKDPLVHINLPKNQPRSSFIQFGGGTGSDTLVTISSRAIIGTHGWSLSSIGGIKESDFTLEIDPSFSSASSTISDAGQAQTTSIGSPRNAVSSSRRRLPGTFTGNVPEWPLSGKLFVVSHDAKYIFSGGHWDNSLQTFSISKTKTVSIVIRHIDTITCLSLDATGSYIMSGSKDTTSIIWEIFPGHSPTMATLHSTGSSTSGSGSGSSTGDHPNPRPIQVLSGHDRSISCVALSTELDMAVSGSEDGTVNVYTIKEGQYIRTLEPINTIGPGITDSKRMDTQKGLEICPPSQIIKDFTVAQLQLSYQGHVVFTGHGKQVHSIQTFTMNGHHLHSSPVGHRITSLVVQDDFIFCGDENGDLILRDLFTGKTLHSLPLHLPIQAVMLVPGLSHALVPLRDGKLVVVGTFHTTRKT